jgi:hypothetical protein
MQSDLKAVSTFVLITLILCSVVFGALISYLWVMGNFYLTSENTVDLIITDVNFPVDHADYFNVTIMNPSYSPSETNITEIYLTVEGDNNIYNVTNTYPEELPIKLEKATSKTIKCLKNWGEFAGKTITVHASAINASGATRSIKTKFVKLEIEAYFNATESCKQFNVTVKNHEGSAINLTLTKVYFNYEPVENMSIQIPPAGLIISPNETIEFRCFVDWQRYGKPLVRVETLEGYTAEIIKEVSSVVILEVTDVTFNETDPNEVSISFFNSPNSATLVEITHIILTYGNGTEYIINGTLTKPPYQLPYKLSKNETITFNCVWSWRNYRNGNVTIIGYTKQGFTSIPKTLKTPPPVVFRIIKLDFNLTNTECFLVTVQNMPCSLQNVTITNATIVYGTKTFKINQTTPEFPYNITIGETLQLNCSFTWSDYRGKNVTVYIYTSQGYNASYIWTLPIVTLNVTFNDAISTQYFSINIQNNAFSNITINGINVNGTWINTTLTYPSLPLTIENGKAMLILCPLDWQSLSGKILILTVTTANEFDITTEVEVP